MKRFGIIFILCLMVGACAHRWREGDTGRSTSDVKSFLSEISTRTNGSTTTSKQALTMADDPSTVIYYSEAPGNLGNVDEVAPFFNFDFFSNVINPYDVASIKVFYLDNSSGARGALIFDIVDKSGNKFVESFVNDGSDAALPAGQFVEDGFYINLKGSSGQTITFFSDDMDEKDDVLKDVIQGQIITTTADGQEQLHGKISTMIGYF